MKFHENSTRSSSFQLKTRPNRSHSNTVHLPMQRGTASAPPDPARASPIVLLPCPLDLGDRNCPSTVRVSFQPRIKYMLKLYLTEGVYYTYIYILLIQFYNHNIEHIQNIYIYTHYTHIYIYALYIYIMYTSNIVI